MCQQGDSSTAPQLRAILRGDPFDPAFVQRLNALITQRRNEIQHLLQELRQRQRAQRIAVRTSQSGSLR